MSRIYEGKLINIQVERHDGYSVGELIQGIKDYMPKPFGRHIHGGNGTYIDYSNAEYIQKDHKIVGVFLVEVTYEDKGENITEITEKKVILADFPKDQRYTTKRDAILSLIASIINAFWERENNVKEYLFELRHEKTDEYNRWIINDERIAKTTGLITIAAYYSLIQKYENVSEDYINENRDELVNSLVKQINDFIDNNKNQNANG